MAAPTNNSATANGKVPSCTILYSTQSKRAKACARRTARILRESTRLQLLGGTTFDEISGMSFLDLAVSKKSDKTHFFLFFVSTTGDGEHCDTIQQTWKSLLKKSLPPDLLEGNQFALFSLGDRAYGPQFCAAGRKLAVRLMQLGMTTKCEPGYGDDQTPNGGVFNDLDDWIQEQLVTSLPNEVKQQQQQNSSNSCKVDTTEYDIKGSLEIPPATGLEEWQQPQFTESYKDFLARQSPITGYSYSGIHRVEDHTQTDQPSNPPLLAIVEANDRLTALHWEQNTRHIKLRVTHPHSRYSSSSTTTLNSSDYSLPYQAGDIATVMPSNSPAEVEKFIQTLPDAVQAIVDQEIELMYRNKNTNYVNVASFGGAYPYWPSKCTLRGWLTYCADIHALPEREDLRALSQFCYPEHTMYQDQRDKLFGLSETQESALYADYILRNKRGWGDVLYDFDSLRFPGSHLTAQALLTLLPPIRPRDFSIASSPSQEVLAKQQQQASSSSQSNGDKTFRLELCVAVVEGTTPLGREYHGLCSHYLSQLQVNKSLVHLWIRPGSFAGLPLEKTTVTSDNPRHWFANPMLCIGAGTGVAPLRALILEREAIKMLAQNNEKVCDSIEAESGSHFSINQFDNILVFGCRKEEMDYYYQDEWKQLNKLGRLCILPAFSRADPTRKVYVQQKIKANGDDIMKHILENDGAIYIAGNPSMARYSKEELVEATTRLLNKDDEKEANILFKKLQAKGRFSVEAWS